MKEREENEVLVLKVVEHGRGNTRIGSAGRGSTGRGSEWKGLEMKLVLVMKSFQEKATMNPPNTVVAKAISMGFPSPKVGRAFWKR